MRPGWWYLRPLYHPLGALMLHLNGLRGEILRYYSERTPALSWQELYIFLAQIKSGIPLIAWFWASDLALNIHRRHLKTQSYNAW